MTTSSPEGPGDPAEVSIEYFHDAMPCILRSTELLSTANFCHESQSGALDRPEPPAGDFEPDTVVQLYMHALCISAVATGNDCMLCIAVE